MTDRYETFGAFYPFYISEHANQTSRRLHVVGTALVLCCLLAGIFLNAWWLLGMPIIGYAFAWVGHFFFKKNKPATFRYPFFSLIGDFRLFYEVVTGRRAF